MAANMKSVKLRIKSVESTMQITKAMELVASSKLRKAKDRADICRPYFRELHQTLVDITEGNLDFSSIYARKSSSEKYCYIVIAGDRGLAGGYNVNLFKCLRKPVPERILLSFPLEKSSRIRSQEKTSHSHRRVCRNCRDLCCRQL
ncbi:MAG: FoF1 ATP synthase subunit gamma [Blautia sp.]